MIKPERRSEVAMISVEESIKSSVSENKESSG
jgi:hypothetical protein